MQLTWLMWQYVLGKLWSRLKLNTQSNIVHMAKKNDQIELLTWLTECSKSTPVTKSLSESINQFNDIIVVHRNWQAIKFCICALKSNPCWHTHQLKRKIKMPNGGAIIWWNILDRASLLYEIASLRINYFAKCLDNNRPEANTIGQKDTLIGESACWRAKP